MITNELFARHHTGTHGLIPAAPRTMRYGASQNSGLCLLFSITWLLALAIPSASQNTLGTLTKGTPVVAQTTGSSGASAASSSSSFDATQFVSGTDLCGAVSLACAAANVGGSATYGADIDARAFAAAGSNPVCSVTTANAMLNNCSNGGKVLLGSYTLWLPLSSTTPMAGSPPGAVLVLPNNFGGFRGISRGSLSCHDPNGNCSAVNTPTSTGTVIAVCPPAGGVPLSNCPGQPAGTSRIWTISSMNVTTVGGTNYIQVNSSGMNLVAGEPVRIDQSNTANLTRQGVDNGAYRVCTPNAGSVTADSHCPFAPNALTVYVVGTSLSVACSSGMSCGSHG